jgi:hypothetical protein
MSKSHDIGGSNGTPCLGMIPLMSMRFLEIECRFVLLVRSSEPLSRSDRQVRMDVT